MDVLYDKTLTYQKEHGKKLTYQRGGNMWKKIIQFDHPNGLGGFVRSPFLNINQRFTGEGTMGTRGMLLFLGNSIYFILALGGDYEEPVYMADLAAAVVI